MDGELQECKDGWIALTCDGGNPWEMSAVFFDAPELIDERFGNRYGRVQHYQEIEAIIGPKLKQRGKWELFNQGMEERFVFGPVQTPDEVMSCPQLDACQAWIEVEHPMAGWLKHPGPGFQVAGLQRRWRPAPLLGQHNEEVYCDEIGLSRQELVQLQQLGIVSQGGQVAPKETRARSPRASSHPRYTSYCEGTSVKAHNDQRLSLQGVRVVTLESIYQLPWTTMVLADMGAEVIRVENLSRLDTRSWRPFPENDPGDRWWDRSGSYHTLGRNKKSVTLDLQQPDGVELLRRLIAVSDVLAENHRPGVLERLGLGYETLRQIKPDLIVLRSSGVWSGGPLETGRGLWPYHSAPLRPLPFRRVRGRPSSAL